MITRGVCERLFDFAFGLAARRQGARRPAAEVTCVDKANVFASMAFFRKIFDERAARFPDIAADQRLCRRHGARPGPQALGPSTCW